MATYVQCVLRISIPGGYRELVSYVPKKLALAGKQIDVDGESGWTIVSVHQSREEHEIARLRKM